jgi:hypothetical protein
MGERIGLFVVVGVIPRSDGGGWISDGSTPRAFGDASVHGERSDPGTQQRIRSLKSVERTHWRRHMPAASEGASPAPTSRLGRVPRSLRQAAEGRTAKIRTNGYWVSHGDFLLACHGTFDRLAQLPTWPNRARVLMERIFEPRNWVHARGSKMPWFTVEGKPLGGARPDQAGIKCSRSASAS